MGPEKEKCERLVTEAEEAPSVVQGVVMGEFGGEMHRRQIIYLKTKFRRVLAFLVMLIGVLAAQHGEYPLGVFFWVGGIALWIRSLYP